VTDDLVDDEAISICVDRLWRFGLPGFSGDAKVSVDMIGIGSMSCAHWRRRKSINWRGPVWTHGFWTGLNYVAAASGQTQPKISMSSIVAEVEKACARKASQTWPAPYGRRIWAKR
jgi:hypothetical protein